ncbi:hypothetical protein TVAG_242480 [Trichomonas vaginalis G3]|uniref:Bap-like n=1 Tax=Trichomonas vaginalis (strain ATCC PRA-98 / G3) TaxID=412133 RepID=A2G274_TRIV3|nr:hypothetical protein TVAGG3_0434030 [Trichomonas vaginalis G3]EAX88739.1 hypothetical protein TVAG_242480 [Trichomonas vaginalis G3]KAI5536961.1 hypothetical protein TVAGG3_0434030 [Trichomonas vaginalis G3]|eukprot:XP_001301669.1 hypothetical protein [Trichomonas vaginalis G3]
MNITTRKTIYKFGEDSTITGTISFDRIKEEPFTLKIKIGNNDLDPILTNNIRSSTYGYSINIQDPYNTGNYTISASVIYSNGIESNTVSVDFEYEVPFVLNLEDIEQRPYNKTLDKNITVKGSRIYSHGDIYINCSIGDANSTFEGKIDKKWTTHQYNFSGVCLIPDSIVEETTYSVAVWVTYKNIRGSTGPKSKEFQFYRNYSVLKISDSINEKYFYNLDSNISVSGFVSDLDHYDEVEIKGNIEGYPNSQTTKNVTISDLNNQSFTINVPIPNNLTIKEHNLLITSCDNKNKCDSIIKTFNYSYNTPEIKILKQPYFPVHINYTRNLNFTLSVSDEDKSDTIYIFHIFNNTISGNNVNITLSNEITKEVKYSIPIPNDISVGIYPIDFYAVDEHDLQSKIISINATISYMTEDLRYFSHKIYRR